jgi:aerobic-type carbon monoxide dehydrogenase small subunit (CoxS/CutS family)
MLRSTYAPGGPLDLIGCPAVLDRYVAMLEIADLIQPLLECGYNVRSIITRASDRVTTIEGLSTTSSHPVQKAWAAIDVPQCGYCQSGQIMAAAALLKRTPKPTDRDIDEAMTNICRCGTYQRIRAAVHLAANDTSKI